MPYTKVMEELVSDQEDHISKSGLNRHGFKTSFYLFEIKARDPK